MCVYIRRLVPRAVNENSTIHIASTKDSPVGKTGLGDRFCSIQGAWRPLFAGVFFYIPRHQVVQAQVALDDDVKNLIDEMDKSCKIADEGAPLKKYSPRFNEILEKLLVQVSECAYFVIDYCREKSFGTCSGSYYLYLPLTGDMFSWASLKVLNLRCQSPSGWLHHQSKGVV